MNLYDKVYSILKSDRPSRNSDKRLIWLVWSTQDLIKDGKISCYSFMQATTPESITRCRRSVQESDLDLQATSARVRRRRQQIQAQKGTHIFREKA